jgi:hypothetical protein
MTKKLYTVSVGFEYACLAESEQDALRYKEEALGDEGTPTVYAQLTVTSGPVRRPRRWTDDALVYGAPYGTDVRLDDAIATDLNRIEQENREAEALKAQRDLPLNPKD